MEKQTCKKVIFLFLCLSSPAVIVFLFSPFNTIGLFIIREGGKSTTTYLSNVGVEALAGVLAIVVSVTLMAVQHSSHEYTHRIMKLYTGGYYIPYVLMGVYIFTISLNVFMLNWIDSINDLNDQFNIKMLEISFAYTWLCFLLLIPYFVLTLNLLMPESIIRKFLKQIDKNFVEANKESEVHPNPRNDPALSVAEIVVKAMKSKDRITIEFGMDEMFDHYKCLIDKESDIFLTNYFLYHFSNMATSAIENLDYETLMRTIDIFEKMARLLKSKGMSDHAINYLIKEFYEIAKKVSNHGDKTSTKYTVKKFVDVVTDLKMSEDDKLCSIGMICSEIEDEMATVEALTGFNKICDRLLDAVINKKQGESIIKGVQKIIDLASNSEEGRTSAIAKASEVIFKANDLKVNSASEELGEYMSEENSGLKDIHALGNGYLFSIYACRGIPSHSSQMEIADSIVLGIDQLRFILPLPLLSYICAELEADLKKCIVSKKWRNIFKTKGFGLSDKARVTEEKENEWVIEDKDKFIIRKEEGMLKIYKKEIYCKFTVQPTNSPNEIILEMNSCCIKTIKKFDDSKLQSCCEKTGLNLVQGGKELPVCTITYSYLEAAIKRITKKNVELKRPVGWNENGFCELTFKLEEQNHSVVPSTHTVL